MIEFTIHADHPCLPGHFPGQPIVPGVVVLDRVLAAIEARHGALGPLRMPQVKFLQPLLPEQMARIELEQIALQPIKPQPIEPQPIEPQPGDTVDAPPRWRFRVLCDEALIASGEVHAT